MPEINGKRCLLDTNVLLFANNRNNPHYNVAANLFEDIRNGRFSAFISIQNLLEFSAVLTRFYKVPAKDAAVDLELLLAHPNLTVLFPTAAVLPVFLNFFKKYTKIYIFDLYLAALVELEKIDTIITDDKDFQRLENLDVYNPFK